MDGLTLRGSVDTHVVDTGPVSDRLEGQPVLLFELRCSERIDTPFDNEKSPLIGDALGGAAHRAMVGMPRHTLWFEDDERGDVIRQPAVDAPVELAGGELVEGPVREIEQRDLCNAEHPSGVEELPATDLTELAGSTQGAGFTVGEAEDPHLTALVRQVGKQRAEPEGFVVGVCDHCGDGTLGERQHRCHLPHRATICHPRSARDRTARQ